MSIPVTHPDIFQFLKKNNWEPTFQKESGQNYIILKVNGQDIHVFFVILAEGALLQVIGYFPFTYLDHMRSDLARFLHLLNKEIDMPGFGMDEMEKLIFYRIVIPCMQRTFDPRLLESYLKAIQSAFDGFYGTIGVIASGSAQIDELIEKSKGKNG